MENFIKIKKNTYVDSLESLAKSSVLNEQPGVEIGYAGMATKAFLDILAEIGLLTEEAAAHAEANRLRLRALPAGRTTLSSPPGPNLPRPLKPPSPPPRSARRRFRTAAHRPGRVTPPSTPPSRPTLKRTSARSQCPASMRWPRSRRR